MAIMAAAIRAGKIEALFSDSPTHDVKVQFPAAGGGFSKEYNFEDVLSLGASQAELSGNFNAAGEYEVWPQVLEMALMDDEIENGGSAPTGLWDAGWGPIRNTLTGKTTVSWKPDDETLPDFIDDQLDESRQVVLGTHSWSQMTTSVQLPNRSLQRETPWRSAYGKTCVSAHRLDDSCQCPRGTTVQRMGSDP